MAENSGSLSISVYTADRAIPVADAAVIIRERNPETGVAKVINVLRTGADGKTETIEIETPPKSNSLTPEGGTIATVLDIESDAKGFYITAINGLEIFEGVTSVQGIPMYPLSDADANSAYPNTVVITRDEGRQNNE